MYREIEKCRLSGSADLRPVLSLGDQYLTGVFPETADADITHGPLDLVYCPDGGLLQLKQSYDLNEMYGLNYGYRSGLNDSMVKHLSAKVQRLEKRVALEPNDVVLDIGSNDATLLKAYSPIGLRRIGIDPTGIKFKEFYPADVRLVPDFFTAESFKKIFPNDRARIVTSIAMFYDLEDPCAFAREIASILAPDGVWHFEQSYMPTMLAANAYDTICHEHLEYYGLAQIRRIVEQAGLRVIDVELNDVNGGSFAVTVAHQASSHLANESNIAAVSTAEEALGLETMKPFASFADSVFKHRDDLRALIGTLRDDGKKLLGYGASTKGNVVLQFCGLTTAEIPAIAEVNPFKFGRFTPGTSIPIIPEVDARAMNPDYLLVLPWHFRSGIIPREADFLKAGGALIFPLPEITVVTAKGSFTPAQALRA